MKKVNRILLLGTIFLTSQQANAIIINIDYSFDSNNFFDEPLRRDTFGAAASFFESRLNDDLGTISSSGSNQYNALFFNPGTGGNASINNFSVAANTITIFAGGRNLSGSTIGEGGPGGYSLSGSNAFLNAVITRGQGDGSRNSVRNPNSVSKTAFDFAPWGGAISFDSNSNWYFDSDVNTFEPFSGNDFYSVALHELGHVLGVGTADSWDNLVNGGLFTGSASSAVNGGNVLLASGDAHWRNGTTSFVEGVSQEAALDPTINTGTRKHFTDLDLAALEDVGWEVSTAVVPVPPTFYLFTTALVGFFSLSKRTLRDLD